MLKKYHDKKGALKEEDLLGVLYELGMVKQRAPVPKGKKPPTRRPRPKKFPVGVYKGRWRWPLNAGVVCSEFGPRWGKNHHGMDIAVDEGSPVFASASGKVLYSDNKLRGYGNAVIIRHDEKTTTLYAHNKLNKVKIGQTVKKGQVIALLGSTGRSTGPHIHYEIRRGNGPVNPRKILPKSSF